jgi:hypothetical protein
MVARVLDLTPQVLPFDQTQMAPDCDEIRLTLVGDYLRPWRGKALQRKPRQSVRATLWYARV